MSEKFGTFVIIIVLIMVVGSVGNVQAALVGHWKLDETSGTIAHDSSGNGHDGVLAPGFSFEKNLVTSLIGNALQFNSKDNYIDVDSLKIPTKAFTIAFWFSPESDLDSTSRRMELIWWKEHDRPYLRFNRDKDGRIAFYVELSGEDYDVKTTTNLWKASAWYHITATFDGHHIKIYVDGRLESTRSQEGLHYPARKARFGINRDGKDLFKGSFADIRIYSHALGTVEIAKVVRLPALDEYIRAVQQAKTMLEKGLPRQATNLLEKKVDAYDQLTQQNAAQYIFVAKDLGYELRFLLAKARNAAGSPYEDVIAQYGRAIGQGQQLLPRAIKVKNMVSQGQLEEAVQFLQSYLTEYVQQWGKSHDNEPPADRLGELYFQLAEMKKASGTSKKDIAEAYSKTFDGLSSKCVPEETLALIWLLNNERGRCREVIRSVAHSENAGEPLLAVLRNMWTYFELMGKWNDFEWLLDATFEEARHPGEWMLFVESSFDGKAKTCAKKYTDHVQRRPRFKFARDLALAERYLAASKYRDAVELYQAILGYCGPEDNRNAVEFGLCRCMFSEQRYSEVISKLDNFVNSRKSTNRMYAKEAMLMKVRTHAQLGQFERSVDVCFVLMMEYPEIKEMPEVVFSMGYCSMLLGKFSEAADALAIVARDYPESSYANKANIYLERIKTMAH